MSPLSLAYGALVGLSLGLTGGGGAIFAIPLLVYGLGVPAREAIGVSLASVGTVSLIGFLNRWRRGQVDLKTGLLFAAAGMTGAPLGAWLAGQIPANALMIAFGVVMVVVALRMWRQSSTELAALSGGIPEADAGPVCRRDDAGRLAVSTPCAILLLFVGLLTGVLSGLFGVGGGFVIVPALVLFSGLTMHRAVGTSLMVVALVSVAGVTAHVLAGRPIPLPQSALFTAGGLAGLLAGQRFGRRLSGPTLQRTFVVAILAVAVFVIARNLDS